MKKVRYKVRPDKDYESEPDYVIILKCNECGDNVTLSGQYAEHYSITQSNFICHYCQFESELFFTI